MGTLYGVPRTCEKGWLCQTFSKRCAANNKYTIWVFVIGKYYKHKPTELKTTKHNKLYI